jgi:hypothetical protein
MAAADFSWLPVDEFASELTNCLSVDEFASELTNCLSVDEFASELTNSTNLTVTSRQIDESISIADFFPPIFDESIRPRDGPYHRIIYHANQYLTFNGTPPS